MDYRSDMKQRKTDQDARRQINDRCPRTPPRRTEVLLQPLNTYIAQVLMAIKNKEFVKWPEKIKINPRQRNKNMYYEFQRDHGHNTEDYL